MYFSSIFGLLRTAPPPSALLEELLIEPSTASDDDTPRDAPTAPISTVPSPLSTKYLLAAPPLDVPTSVPASAASPQVPAPSPHEYKLVNMNRIALSERALSGGTEHGLSRGLRTRVPVTTKETVEVPQPAAAEKAALPPASGEDSPSWNRKKASKLLLFSACAVAAALLLRSRWQQVAEVEFVGFIPDRELLALLEAATKAKCNNLVNDQVTLEACWRKFAAQPHV